MSEKTIIYSPEGAGYGSNGLDPNLWMSMMNNGGMGGGNFFWAIILLAFLRNGLGWNGGDGNYNMSYIASQLAQGFGGNTNAISNLATSLNCTNGQIQQAIAGIQATIQSVGAQNNLSFAQTVNAIQAGNTAIANQISQCCCDNKLLTTQQGYENRINNLQQSQLIQNGFSQVGYAAAEQTCAIKQNNTDNTNRVIAKLDAIEDSRKDREIASLTAALTAANSRAERQSELAPIYKALNDIQCKQPNTVTVPANNGVLVPSCVAYQMGLYGGFPYGYNPSGSIWS